VTIIVAKRAFHRGNPPNPYYIPRDDQVYSATLHGTPNTYNNSKAVTSFYGGDQPGTPKLRFSPTVATIFIVPKGGDTQILITTYRCQPMFMP
jgi:hypothetical protein